MNWKDIEKQYWDEFTREKLLWYFKRDQEGQIPDAKTMAGYPDSNDTDLIDLNQDISIWFKSKLKEAMKSVVPEVPDLKLKYYKKTDWAWIDGYKECEEESLQRIFNFFKEDNGGDKEA